MKRFIAVWASVQYAVHVDGATVHVTGPDERQVEFGDGTTSFATLSGGEGFINSTVTVNAPDFVTMTGTSVNEMMTLIRDQQAKIKALEKFVGMMPPSAPPAYILPPPPPPPSRCGCHEAQGPFSWQYRPVGTEYCYGRILGVHHCFLVNCGCTSNCFRTPCF